MGRCFCAAIHAVLLVKATRYLVNHAMLFKISHTIVDKVGYPQSDKKCPIIFLNLTT